MTALVALIIVPVVASVAAGFGAQTSAFVVAGIQQTGPVAAMFLFAILYFGVMTDAGMLDPIVDRILGAVGTRPTRIVMGSALLALLVHLDGSGAVTFLLTIPAMLPLCERLRMDKRVLACVGSDLWLLGRLLAVREDESGANGSPRSAAVDRGTLRHVGGIRLRGASGGGTGGNRAVSAARGRRSAHCRSGIERCAAVRSGQRRGRPGGLQHRVRAGQALKSCAAPSGWPFV